MNSEPWKKGLSLIILYKVIIKAIIIITNQVIIVEYENVSNAPFSIWILRIWHSELLKIRAIPRTSQMIIKADMKIKLILKNVSMLVNSVHFFFGYPDISIVKAREMIQVMNHATSQVLFLSYFVKTHSLSGEFKKLNPMKIYLYPTGTKKMTEYANDKRVIFFHPGF